jgi:hypothetical protein
VYGPGILTARNINVNLETVEPGLIFDEGDCNGFSDSIAEACPQVEERRPAYTRYSLRAWFD